MNEQGEQQKQVERCVVVCPLNAKNVHWVEYAEGIPLCQFMVWLIPRIKVKLEYVLDNDQHLSTKHTYTPFSQPFFQVNLGELVCPFIFFLLTLRKRTVDDSWCRVFNRLNAQSPKN